MEEQLTTKRGYPHESTPTLVTRTKLIQKQKTIVKNSLSKKENLLREECPPRESWRSLKAYDVHGPHSHPSLMRSDGDVSITCCQAWGSHSPPPPRVGVSGGHKHHGPSNFSVIHGVDIWSKHIHMLPG